MRVEGSIDIAAPPEKIWPFMSDPDKIMQWYTTLERFEFTGEQRSGVGAPFYCEERAGGRLLKLHFKVTEWVENERVAFSMTSGDLVKKYDQTWVVAATESGSTFTLSEDIGLPYWIIGKIMGLFARRESEKTIREILANLKRLAEA
jgi:uncharacterized protein YndB with AHSA1/START domain